MHNIPAYFECGKLLFRPFCFHSAQRVSNLPFSFAASALDRDWPAFEYCTPHSGAAAGEVADMSDGSVMPSGRVVEAVSRPELDELLAHQAATILSLWPEAADLEDPPDTSQGSGRVFMESFYFEDERADCASEHSNEEDEYTTPSTVTATSLSTMFARRAELAQMAVDLVSGSEDMESDDGTLLLEGENGAEGDDSSSLSDGEGQVEGCWAGWGVLWEEVEPPPTKKRRLSQPSLVMSL